MTLIFWFIAWAITLLVLGLLLWPLLKRQVSLKMEDGEKLLSVYRQQFAELEQDLKDALLTDGQYQSQNGNSNDGSSKRQGLPRPRLRHGCGQ